MLQWNELRVTPDGKYLIVDVEVQNKSFYDNIYINNLTLQIYSEKTKNTSNSTTLYIWRDYNVPQLEGEKYLEVGQKGERYKRLKKIIDIDTIGDCLFFVTATNTDDFAADTPCGARQTELYGTAYNRYLLYSQSIKALKTVNACTPNESLINYILQFKMFELALELGDTELAVTYWNKYIKGKTPAATTTNCGCYG